VPSFILSGAPFFQHSRTKLGTRFVAFEPKPTLFKSAARYAIDVKRTFLIAMMAFAGGGVGGSECLVTPSRYSVTLRRGPLLGGGIRYSPRAGPICGARTGLAMP
jgi:hypothetical protein